MAEELQLEMQGTKEQERADARKDNMEHLELLKVMAEAIVVYAQDAEAAGASTRVPLELVVLAKHLVHKGLKTQVGWRVVTKDGLPLIIDNKVSDWGHSPGTFGMRHSFSTRSLGRIWHRSVHALGQLSRIQARALKIRTEQGSNQVDAATQTLVDQISGGACVESFLLIPSRRIHG